MKGLETLTVWVILFNFFRAILSKIFHSLAEFIVLLEVLFFHPTSPVLLEKLCFEKLDRSSPTLSLVMLSISNLDSFLVLDFLLHGLGGIAFNLTNREFVLSCY